jgi:hypothetical protein
MGIASLTVPCLADINGNLVRAMASSNTDGGGRFKAVRIFPPKNQNQNSDALVCSLSFYSNIQLL